MNNDDNTTLIARHLAGEATPDDQALLKKWLMASPEHQRQLAEFERLWQSSLPPVVDGAPHREEAWQDLRDRLHRTSPPVYSRRVTLYSILAVAAVLLVIFSGVLIQQYRERQNDIAFKNSPAWNEVATANGQQTDVILPDSTTVRLNAATKLTFPANFSDSLRMALLEGEAFFDVAPDSSRPFVIHTPNSRIRVFGTAFNIWTRHSETRVVVKTGRVFLSPVEARPGTGVHIAANQMSIHRMAAMPEPPKSVDADRKIGWLNGALIFEQTALGEMVEEIQRHFDVTVVVADSTLISRHLTAAFKDQPVGAVLDAISMALGTRYTLDRGRYVLTD